MAELFGLQVIVSDAVESGTLHAITPPPIRGDFPTQQKYEWALRWWERNQLWTTFVQEKD